MPPNASIVENKPADWLARKQKISVKRAAELNDLSEATFRRHYAHLIRKISARRDVVELGDAVDLPPVKS